MKEVKRKSEDDFGNSTGNKNTRSSEMKSKFQRERRIRIVFQKQKKGKSTKFSGKFISFLNENCWKVWSKLKSGMRILWMEPLMEAQKEDAKEKERDREFLKAVNYFRKKAPP